MQLHKLLLRQLNSLDLKLHELPNMEQWQNFIAKINRVYEDVDQDRYLLERSMDISSREMSKLNKKLESAQKIAKMGYWFYDRNTQKIIWSKPLYEMLRYNRTKPVPSVDELMGMVDPAYREKLQQLIDIAFGQCKEYEFEFRMKRFNSKEYRWYYVIGHPSKNDEGVITLSGVMMDITKRKISEIEIEKLHSKLMESARRTGMAEVATTVLHNVGNILNSANVSLSVIQDYIAQDYTEKLNKIQTILAEKQHNLAEFLLYDEKGKLIPAYLFEVLTLMKTGNKILLAETKNLMQYLEHITKITTMQKSLSGKSVLFEQIYLPEIIDMSMKMCGNLSKYHISVNIAHADPIHFETDKTKLLQVLCNLIQNAKDALLMGKCDHKKLLVSSYVDQLENKLKIMITDNGIGISPENLTKIFTFGFTTKTAGHGFGLHSSALAIKELNGELQVTSQGVEKGTTFTILLPLTKHEVVSHGKKEKLKNYSD